MHAMCNNNIVYYNWVFLKIGRQHSFNSLALIQTECLGLFLAPCVLYRQRLQVYPGGRGVHAPLSWLKFR